MRAYVSSTADRFSALDTTRTGWPGYQGITTSTSAGTAHVAKFANVGSTATKTRAHVSAIADRFSAFDPTSSGRPGYLATTTSASAGTAQVAADENSGFFASAVVATAGGAAIDGARSPVVAGWADARADRIARHI